MSELRFFDELEAELERVAHRRPPRHPGRRLVRATALAVAIAVVAAVVLSLSGNGNPGPSLLSRAYAATSSAGQILFYKTTSYSPGEDKPDQYAARQRSTASVWTSGDRVRTTETLVLGGAPGHPPFTTLAETVVDGDRYTDWNGTPGHPVGMITKFTLPNRASSCTAQEALVSSSCGTPLEAVRELYRSGALHFARRTVFHGQRVDVLTETTPGPPPSGGQRRSPLHTQVLVNAKTFTPVVIYVSSRDFRATTTFADFTRLPLTPANQHLLQMAAHPGAPVQYMPAGGIRVTTSSTTPSSSAPTGARSLGTSRLADEISTGAYASARGAVDLVRSNRQDGLVLLADGLPRSPHTTAYGIWLINAATDATRFLGSIVAKNGVLSAAVALPPSARSDYRSVELTMERGPGTTAPTRPGTVVLRGKLP